MEMRTDSSTPTQRASLMPRRVAVWAGVLLLMSGAYGFGWYHRNHRYDGFAQCMASKQVRMYGAYWCPHCAEQKEMLGKSYRFLYEECGVSGSHAEQQKCADLGVKLFPTWRFPDGTLAPGVFSPQDLSSRSGCNLP